MDLHGNVKGTALNKVIKENSWKEERELQDIYGSVFSNYCFSQSSGVDFRSSEEYQAEPRLHKLRELILSNRSGLSFVQRAVIGSLKNM